MHTYHQLLQRVIAWCHHGGFLDFKVYPWAFGRCGSWSLVCRQSCVFFRERWGWMRMGKTWAPTAPWNWNTKQGFRMSPEPSMFDSTFYTFFWEETPTRLQNIRFPLVSASHTSLPGEKPLKVCACRRSGASYNGCKLRGNALRKHHGPSRIDEHVEAGFWRSITYFDVFLNKQTSVTRTDQRLNTQPRFGITNNSQYLTVRGCKLLHDFEGVWASMLSPCISPLPLVSQYHWLVRKPPSHRPPTPIPASACGACYAAGCPQRWSRRGSPRRGDFTVAATNLWKLQTAPTICCLKKLCSMWTCLMVVLVMIVVVVVVVAALGVCSGCSSDRRKYQKIKNILGKFLSKKGFRTCSVHSSSYKHSLYDAVAAAFACKPSWWLKVVIYFFNSIHKQQFTPAKGFLR